jgi:hypothetical protein
VQTRDVLIIAMKPDITLLAIIAENGTTFASHCSAFRGYGQGTSSSL